MTAASKQESQTNNNNNCTGGGKGGSGKGGGGGGNGNSGNGAGTGSGQREQSESLDQCLLCASVKHVYSKCGYKNNTWTVRAKKLDDGDALRAKLKPKATEEFKTFLSDIDKLSAKLRASIKSNDEKKVMAPSARNFGVPEDWGDDSDADEDAECPADWTTVDDEKLSASGAGVGAFGYVSAAVTKSACAAAGVLISSVGAAARSAQKIVTGKVALHPDSVQDSPLLKVERRAARKQLTAMSAFNTMHLLGVITAAALPIRAGFRRGNKIVAVQTRGKARGTPKAAAPTSDIPESDEDDEGI